MELYIIAICILLIIAILAYVIVKFIIPKTIYGKEVRAVIDGDKHALVAYGKHEMAIVFDNLPSLSEQEESQLVEVKGPRS